MSNQTQFENLPKNMSYEEAINKLEEIIESLESQEHSLEESIALFERGKQLASYCSELLENAELRIKTIVNDNIIDFPEPPV